MLVFVSVSDLRSNISSYLNKVAQGATVMVRDEKKNITVAALSKVNSFNKDLYEQALRKAAGVFSAEKHPEWETKKNVSSWVVNQRLSDQRET